MMGKHLLFLLFLNLEFSNPLKAIEKEAGISLFSIQICFCFVIKDIYCTKWVFLYFKRWCFNKTDLKETYLLLYLLSSHNIHNLERDEFSIFLSHQIFQQQESSPFPHILQTKNKSHWFLMKNLCSILGHLPVPNYRQRNWLCFATWCCLSFNRLKRHSTRLQDLEKFYFVYRKQLRWFADLFLHFLPWFPWLLRVSFLHPPYSQFDRWEQQASVIHGLSKATELLGGRGEAQFLHLNPSFTRSID